MGQVDEIFTARELATLVWGVLALVWAVRQPKIRNSLVNLLRAFFKVKILSPILLLSAYVAVVVLALRRVGFWDLSVLKDTITWFIGAGVVTLLAAGTAKDASGGFRSIVAEIFTVAVVVEFLANLYSFPLWAELLALPIVVMAVGVRVLADYRTNLDVLKKPLDWFVALYGLAVLGVSLFGVFNALDDFLTVGTLRAFLLPILLSVAALPYLYMFLLVMQYELSFLRLRWTIDDPKLRSFAKRRLLQKFHFRLGALQRWQAARGLRSAATKAEFLELLHGHARNSATQHPSGAA